MKNKLKVRLNFLIIMPMICAIKYGLSFSDSFALFQMTIVFTIGLIGTLAMCLINSSYRQGILKINIIYLAFYIAFLFLYSAFIKDSDSYIVISTYIRQLLMLFIFYAAFVWLQLQSYKERNFIVFLFFICAFVSSLYTYYVSLTIGSNVIRQSTVSDYSDLYNFKYGGYDFIYALVLMYYSTLIAFIHHRKNLKLGIRILAIAFFATTYLTVIASGFGTALLLLVVGTVSLVMQGRKLFIVIPIVIVLFFLFFSDQTLSMIYNSSIIPDLTKTRIVNILYLISGKVSSVNDYSSRLKKALGNLTIISKYPLFGGVTRVGAFDFGRHTEWLDQIARYGLLSFLIYFGFWKTTKRIMIDYSRSGTDSEMLNCDSENNIKKTFVLFTIIGVFLNFSIDTMSVSLFIFTPFIDEFFVLKSRD